jgi:polysaccharide deacetylase family protein (PEP-CTERM system associated)
MVHHFTIDVEEYFHVSALEGVVARHTWDSLPQRAAESTRHIAEMMAETGSRGTMFVLGWLAMRQPSLIRDLAQAGHEIASHGMDHRRVTTQNQAEFRESVRRSKGLLEEITGQPVLGFRAPSYSIVRGTEWALDILGEEGYLYDSSLYPVRRKGYGFPGGLRDPHLLTRSKPLHEVPPATLRLLGCNLPAGGGGYFRLLPYQLLQLAFEQAERRGQPATFYIHPWEIDSMQPRFKVGTLTRIRHYRGLDRTATRLKRLLRQYRFAPIAENLGLTNLAPAC